MGRAFGIRIGSRVASEHQLRRELLRFARMCYERNLLVAMDGNLSVRLSSREVLCTRSGCHKGFLTDEDLVVVDMQGRHLRGAGSPTSEMAMHLACYAERPDIQAIIHAHPPLSIAFTIAGQSLARCVLPEVVLTLGVVPTVEYATTGTQVLAEKLRAHAKSHDVLLMDRHGAVALGRDLLEAFCRLETLEHTALITKSARDLGTVRQLPPEEATRLRKLGLERYGGPPAAVARLGEAGADLPEACLGCSGCAAPTTTGIGPRVDLRLARLTEGPLQRLGDGTGRHDGPGSRDFEDHVVKQVLQALSDP